MPRVGPPRPGTAYTFSWVLGLLKSGLARFSKCSICCASFIALKSSWMRTSRSIRRSSSRHSISNCTCGSIARGGEFTALGGGGCAPSDGPARGTPSQTAPANP
eukprot:181351-Prorocentrum_minimum.AAC.2